jgi:WD40 repeat protein
VTPDGNLAINDSYKTLRVWEIDSGQEQFTLQGHAHLIAAVTVTPDGRFAISASFDHTLKVWDLESTEAVHTLQGHTYWVRSVAVTPDGKYAISASLDKTLRIWNIARGETVATFLAESPLSACAAGPDGSTVIVGDESGQVHILHLPEMDD